jgi:hypothetical protein
LIIKKKKKKKKNFTKKKKNNLVKIMVKISFLGAGRMNSAIIKGMLNSGKFLTSQINCSAGNGKSGPTLA